MTTLIPLALAGLYLLCLFVNQIFIFIGIPIMDRQRAPKAKVSIPEIETYRNPVALPASNDFNIDLKDIAITHQRDIAWLAKAFNNIHNCNKCPNCKKKNN